MIKTVALTCFFLVLQDFPRISAKVPASFAPKRFFPDDVDPDPYILGNVHKMGPTHSHRPGNPSASGLSGSDDDDCVVLEVFDSPTLSLLFFFFDAGFS
jgi:hypothetical protein